MNKEFGGWAGYILRVDLTNNIIKKEPTSTYHNYIGGMGIGYKVLWDNHKDGITATDEENRLVISAGPLSGSGAICSARTTITSRSPVIRNHLITDGHFGGHFSPEMKYAGYDAIIIEGKSSTPVWLKIIDDKVTLEPADSLWGKGMFDTFAAVSKMMGQQAQVAAIGPAGENLVSQSTIQTQGGHSAGGHGAVLGSKQLKAIGIIGTGVVNVVANNEQLRKLDDHILGIIGANNQGVVPHQPQTWAEYSSSISRWRGGPGVKWGAADKPVDVGETPWDDRQKVGMRTSMAEMYFGREEANRVFKRPGGCHSCPIRCFCEVKNPKMKTEYKLPTDNISNTCMGFLDPWYVMGLPANSEKRTDIQTVGAYYMDNYGVWSAYGQLSHVMREFITRDFWKQLLPAEEFAAINWQQQKDLDAHFMEDFYTRLALGKQYKGSNVLGRFLGKGLHEFINEEGELYNIQDILDGIETPRMAGLIFNLESDAAYGLTGKNYSVFLDKGVKVFNRSMVGGTHHASETAGQVGALLNTVFNRDPQCHSHINLVNCGLPYGKIAEVADKMWGAGAFDPVKHYKPMNVPKAKFAKWCLVKNVLHDSLTLCNWMFPLIVSPDVKKDYQGDSSIESQMFSLVTGIQTSEQELDDKAEGILQLHRALSVLQMQEIDQRNKHDVLTEWVYDLDPDKVFGDEGTIKMGREDMQLGLDLFYAEMGWDQATGTPTRATLEKFKLGYVADKLESLGLLPA
ncbi:aldehyde ferredoxin oxidoreductase [Shewanella sp. 1CM18E]|uniref:aldehyde ferredoxin oxidoreductase n=1 Tax=Shewanella sp. 1CM18E TaxID=2929169 RepID=UPI0020C06D4B|nr:aldehyde ferredoxin oxidoreductase [Shewanella sp. 1CM18E]MCK8044915.1 aldehyde ferredoxin oxidoreductase [Shewanella sp. 1CM18E]